MIQITKIFRFEMAHAIYGYPGKCEGIHGHSYELHVSIAPHEASEEPIGGTGLVMDFKLLKRIVVDVVINQLDHQLVLSRAFIQASQGICAKNIVTWDFEPSAENILLYTRRQIEKNIPAHVRLCALKLYETADSYASWKLSE